MTAVNACILQGGTGAVILTDTVAYDDDGIVFGFEAKVKTLPHKAMAIATRGGSKDSAWAADMADRCEDTDHCHCMLTSIADSGMAAAAEANFAAGNASLA